MTTHLDAVSAEDRDEEFAPAEPGEDRGHSLGRREPTARGTGAPDPSDRAGSTAQPSDETDLDALPRFRIEARMRLMSDGYNVLGHAPYAMRTVREQHRDTRSGRLSNRSRLEPGDQQEIEVVRLIFELYGCQKMPVNHILNILRAENVPARHKNSKWSLQKIERILTDPVYIGAVRYKNFVRYDAFQPIVEPWIFYAALSRRHFEKLSKYGPQVQQEVVRSNEGVAHERRD